MKEIKATCPRCGLTAHGFEEVSEKFGFRGIRVQSYDRVCRAQNGKEQRANKKALAEIEKTLLPQVPAHVELPPLSLARVIVYKGQGVHRIGQLVEMSGSVWIVEPSGALRFVRKA